MKSVSFSSTSKLPCQGVSGAPLIICLVSDTLLESGLSTFTGTLLNSSKLCCDPCNSDTWRYTIQYDETLLADPGTPLVSDDIKGIICEDSCLIKWIQENFTPLP